MIEFLTHEEVCELTGAKTKKAQIQNLKTNGVRHTIKVNGWPCVTAFAVNGQGPVPVVEEEERPRWVPDFSKVR
ncbi:DUF4224 domain-containing protein [Pseudomonas fluorescens]|uniref:DUF4224 domain-containing protein n=1 Tax=Pseudomonas fluorescens TaxID=294 RepID=UPI000375CF30|nr:DUF4224 domain-containing protein [Pseudomonas fluorescens]